MTSRRRRHKAKTTSVSEICGLSGASMRDWDRQTENSVLNNTEYGKGKVVGRAKFRFWIRGGVCYTYVHPNSYRGAYRYLQRWQRLWGNYERRHPSDDIGLPVDLKRPTHVSLERLQEAGLQVVALQPTLVEADLPDEVRHLAAATLSEFIEAVNKRLAE